MVAISRLIRWFTFGGECRRANASSCPGRQPAAHLRGVSKCTLCCEVTRSMRARVVQMCPVGAIESLGSKPAVFIC